MADLLDWTYQLHEAAGSLYTALHEDVGPRKLANMTGRIIRLMEERERVFLRFSESIADAVIKETRT